MNGGLSAVTLIIVAVIALIGPLLLAELNSRQRRKERIEDYARQDAVADKVALAAETLVKTGTQATERATSMFSKLEIIHTLVNSNMTAALQSELDAWVGKYAALEETIALHKAARRRVPAKSVGELRAAKVRIAELKVTIAERLEQTKVAEMQAQTASNEAAGHPISWVGPA